MSAAAALVQVSLLGEAVEGARIAVLVTEETGRYVVVNSFACELLGYEREELLSLSVADIAAGPDVEAQLLDIAAVPFQEGECELRRKDGSTFRFKHRTGHTTMAGMAYYVSVGWPAV